MKPDPTSPAADKRTRLLDAATRLVGKRGFGQTSLADIASEAGVPLGNVYYYFKTKDDIGRAILARHCGFFDAFTESVSHLADPRRRLMALVDTTMANRNLVAESGCPIGTLCQELGKQPGALRSTAGAALERQLQWMTAQFKAIGTAQAAAHAEHLLAALQGASLLTNAFGDPRVMQREGNRLKKWLRSIG